MIIPALKPAPRALIDLRGKRAGIAIAVMFCGTFWGIITWALI